MAVNIVSVTASPITPGHICEGVFRLGSLRRRPALRESSAIPWAAVLGYIQKEESKRAPSFHPLSDCGYNVASKLLPHGFPVMMESETVGQNKPPLFCSITYSNKESNQNIKAF